MSADSLTIDEHGLSAAEVAERVARGAVNRVKDRTSRSVASIIRDHRRGVGHRAAVRRPA